MLVTIKKYIKKKCGSAYKSMINLHVLKVKEKTWASGISAIRY